MSLRGEHDGSFAGEFVQSIILERDLISSKAGVGQIGATATGVPQPPKLIEATPAIAGGHFEHQHRALVPYRLLNAASVGAAPSGSLFVQVANLGARAVPGFKRAYFRVRGICPLIPWSTDANGAMVVEAQWHLNPYGWIAEIGTNSAAFQGHVGAVLTIARYPDLVGFPSITQSLGPTLNLTREPTQSAPLGAFSIDRLVAYSIAETGGRIDIGLGAGIARSILNAYYQSGPESDVTWPGLPTPGEETLGAIFTVKDLIWPNDLGVNPPSLVPPHEPMITQAIGDPTMSNWLQVQYIGFRHETLARQEEILDLIPPLLVTVLP